MKSEVYVRDPDCNWERTRESTRNPLREIRVHVPSSTASEVGEIRGARVGIQIGNEPVNFSARNFYSIFNQLMVYI